MPRSLTLNKHPSYAAYEAGCRCDPCRELKHAAARRAYISKRSWCGCGRSKSPRRKQCRVCGSFSGSVAQWGPQYPAEPLRQFIRSHIRHPVPKHLRLGPFVPMGNDQRPSLNQVGDMYDLRYGTAFGRSTVNRITYGRAPWVSVWLADRILTLFNAHLSMIYDEEPITELPWQRAS